MNEGSKMTRYLLAFSLLAVTPMILSAQEGPTPTQTLVQVDSKASVIPTANDITLKVDGRVTPLTSIAPVKPSGAQVALLIDDGLRMSVGRELSNLRQFIQSLRPGTEVFVGYMQNGRVVPAQNFTTDYAAAAQSLRLPRGTAGISASPYFCVSDFVKNWPTVEQDQADLQRSMQPVHKARFVLMITNGVDPYNGSTSITNQDSPYVQSAVTDAQRAGVAVYSIYYSDEGFRGRRGSFSGQSYLQQIAQGTGGTSYYQGTGSPVSLEPFLKQFQNAIAESYIATFPAPGGKGMVRISLKTKLSQTKLHVPEQVRPGNQLSAQAQ